MRRELVMRSRIARVARRIGGLDNPFVLYQPSRGTIVAGLCGKSRVVVIPVPCDQRRWEANDFENISASMATAATDVIDLLDEASPLKGTWMPRIRSFSCSMTFSATVQPGCPMRGTSTDGSMTIDAFYYDGTQKLRSRGLRNFRWTDAADSTPISLSEKPATVSPAITRENTFCDGNWPRNVTGRWRQIEALTTSLGIVNLFDTVHHLLSCGPMDTRIRLPGTRKRAILPA
ncbi:MAG: hypothetical protein K0S56_999 [Microvirga sp.]|jgi:hypothetical protein|nr:hypothetical protein [Microvirga sp.]